MAERKYNGVSEDRVRSFMQTVRQFMELNGPHYEDKDKLHAEAFICGLISVEGRQRPKNVMKKIKKYMEASAEFAEEHKDDPDFDLGPALPEIGDDS